MKKSISLYLKYISVVLQSAMQYKVSFLLMVTGRFFVAFSSFLGIYFLFSGFSEIGGYTYGEVLLCFSVLQMSFAIAECIFSGFKSFSAIVKRGEFDRMLVRPRSPILQVLGTRFELGRIGPMLTGIIMLIVGIANCPMSWNPGKVFTLVLMIIGGTFLFAGLFMVEATLCFFSLEDPGCINVLTYGAKEHGKYPIDVYGKGIMKFCTFVVPYTLIQYYPLQFLLGRTDKWQYALCPVGIVFFLVLCYGFWRFGLRRYKSSGS